MKLENSFQVPAGLEESWKVITDVPALVSCMPGAQLTGADVDGLYRGIARVKIGPVQLEFNGEARLYDVDARAHRMKVRSRASDAKGRGTVASEMAFVLSADGDRTRVDVVTDLALTGSVAQYGRGAGLIKEVANRFTQDFAANLERLVLTRTRAAAKPASGLRLLFGALRAMLARWLGRRPA